MYIYLHQHTNLETWKVGIYVVDVKAAISNNSFQYFSEIVKGGATTFKLNSLTKPLSCTELD